MFIAVVYTLTMDSIDQKGDSIYGGRDEISILVIGKLEPQQAGDVGDREYDPCLPARRSGLTGRAPF